MSRSLAAEIEKAAVLAEKGDLDAWELFVYEKLPGLHEMLVLRYVHLQERKGKTLFPKGRGK